MQVSMQLPEKVSNAGDTRLHFFVHFVTFRARALWAKPALGGLLCVLSRLLFNLLHIILDCKSLITKTVDSCMGDPLQKLRVHLSPFDLRMRQAGLMAFEKE